tara:strand:- start:1068 stop:1556 length:489 start_codon:yes stop_codon:yes gene_type:complete
MDLKINRVIKNWKNAHKIKYTKNYVTNHAGPGRRFAKQNPNIKLWKEAFKQFNLFPVREDPFYGTLLMNHYLDGSFTHPHQDNAEEGYAHIRANVMIKKPKYGGDIIIDNKFHLVEINDLWLVIASMEKHASMPIKDGERLIYSFGASIKKEEIEKIIKYAI